MSQGGERKDGTRKYPGYSVLGTHRNSQGDVQEPILREHSSYVRVLGNGKGKSIPPQYSQRIRQLDRLAERQ